MNTQESRLDSDTPRARQDYGECNGKAWNDSFLAENPCEGKTLYDPDVFMLFVKPGEITEVRGFDGKRVYAGYFDEHQAFCKEVQALDKRLSSGIYFTLQVIDPRLIGRAHNRIRQADRTTTDKDVLFYRWLPIDLDPVRPAGISSSDSELQAALDLLNPVTEWVMQEIGLPAPIKAMSGNGGHLLFRLPDWPVSDETKAIIKGILEDISSKFSTDRVHIDITVFNPARIWKLYGTTARKGDEIPANQYREARLHRMAYIDDLGGNHG